MKLITIPLIVAALLTGCSSGKFTPEDIVKDSSGLPYNAYSACLSNTVAKTFWPDDVGPADKTVDICRSVDAPNPECETSLRTIAEALEDGGATLAMVNASRDACETGREVGPAYVKAAPAWDSNTANEAEFYEGRDGSKLLGESRARLNHRTAFTRKMLPDIRKCYESAVADSCYAVLTAKTTVDDGNDDRFDDPAQGYLLDEYGCVWLVKNIVQWQALHNQPGFVLVGGPAHYAGRPTDEDNYNFYGTSPERRGHAAMRCNLELRKSGLPELS